MIIFGNMFLVFIQFCVICFFVYCYSTAIGVSALPAVLCVCRRQKSIDAYRAEVSCVNRLRHEIVTLRHLVSSQQQTISTLTANCQQLRREKYLLGLFCLSCIPCVYCVPCVIDMFCISLVALFIKCWTNLLLICH